MISRQVALKYLCSRTVEYGANEPAASYVDDGVRFLRTTDITDDGRLTPSELGVFLPKELAADFLLETGDLLLSRSGTIGRALLFDRERHGECAYAGYLVRFRPRNDVQPRFLFYFTKTTIFDDQIAAAAVQSTIMNFNGQKFASMLIPLPEPNLQSAIASFLDRKTAAIDAVIEKKERLIELLQEKRQALITQAVTKGLDPNVPMKDSGIEWVGHIPANWDVAPLYSRFTVQLGKMLDSSREDGSRGYPYLRNANVHWGRLDLADVKTMVLSSADRARYRLSHGDLLVCEGGANINVVGKSAIWRGELSECYYQKALHRVRPCRARESSEFLMYALWSAFAHGVFIAGANASTVFHLTAEKLRAHRFAFPPAPEQLRIAEYLERHTSSLDRLADRTRQSVEQLFEYRQALITAAVTGKLDLSSEAA